jgi:uncharacterized protein (UPF0212 family)
MRNYRCYFLNGNSIVSAMFAHVESVDHAILLARSVYHDVIYSPQIDHLEIWLGTAKCQTLALESDTVPPLRYAARC